MRKITFTRNLGLSRWRAGVSTGFLSDYQNSIKILHFAQQLATSCPISGSHISPTSITAMPASSELKTRLGPV